MGVKHDNPKTAEQFAENAYDQADDVFMSSLSSAEEADLNGQALAGLALSIANLSRAVAIIAKHRNL